MASAVDWLSKRRPSTIRRCSSTSTSGPGRRSEPGLSPGCPSASINCSGVALGSRLSAAVASLRRAYWVFTAAPFDKRSFPENVPIQSQISSASRRIRDVLLKDTDVHCPYDYQRPPPGRPPWTYGTDGRHRPADRRGAAGRRPDVDARPGRPHPHLPRQRVRPGGAARAGRRHHRLRRPGRPGPLRLRAVGLRLRRHRPAVLEVGPRPAAGHARGRSRRAAVGRARHPAPGPRPRRGVAARRGAQPPPGDPRGPLDPDGADLRRGNARPAAGDPQG